MKVLVTGGAGFIGSHVVDALLQGGHDVAVMDDLSTGNLDNVNPGARLYDLSITGDGPSLEEVFAQERPQVVNHHAAQTSVRLSMSDPSFDARVNVIGSINILQQCVTHGVERMIFASSCAVYTEPLYIPMDECHSIGPQSAYGLAKHTVENYARLYSGAFGLRYVVLRYGNVFGPRQNPHGEAGVMAIFVHQLSNGISPTIYGDGTKTRDYVYVGDIARANLIAMGGDGDGEVFNLARGVEVTDYEVFDAIREATGVGIEPIYGQKRPGEADRVALDCSKAKRLLGWSPEVSLQEGIRNAVEHYRTRGTR